MSYTGPLISIITITYNAAGELAPTMESVKEQSFTDYEHLIIDGSSSDNTLEIARSLGGNTLRILSEPDNGLYDAMNKGLRMAKGKYVLFLNAGDSFHSSLTLEAYGREALKNLDVIYADTVIVDKNRHVLSPRHLSAPKILSFHSFSNGMLVCHQAFMVRKSIAPEYNVQYRFSADYDWTVRCIKNTKPGRCVNLNMVAIDYLSDGLTDKNKLKSLRERFAIMCAHYGTLTTLVNHVKFLIRAAKRKF